MNYQDRVLLTTHNSQWGIIVNPIASNVYQHILSWESDELKDWFIQSNLFPTEKESYKELIMKQPKIAVAIEDLLHIKFRVDLHDYPNETDLSLLKKDYAIVLHDDTFLFYQVEGKIGKSGFVIEYDGELDIFLTFNIKDMFKNKTKKSQIKFAHSDLGWDDKGQLVMSYDSHLNFPEEEGQDINLSFSSNSREVLGPEHNSFSTYSLLPFKEISYTAGLDEVLPSGVIDFTRITIKPNNYASVSIGNNYGLIPNEIITPDKKVFFLKASHSPNTPLGEFLIPQQLINEKSNDSFYVYIESKTSNGTGGQADSKWEGVVSGLKTRGKIENELLYPYPNCSLNELKDINKEFLPKTIGKLFYYPFRSISLHSLKGENYEFGQQFLIDDNLTIKYCFSDLGLLLWVYPNLINSPRENNFNGLFTTINPTSQIDINAQDQYQAYNKASYNNTLKIAKKHRIESYVSAGVNALSGIAKLVKGDIGGAISTAGSVGNEIANAADEVNTIKAQQTDLRNQPDQISGSNGDFWSVLAGEYTFVSSQVNDMNPILKQKLAYLFHLRGYSMNSLYYDIDEYISTRYYFNYLKTGSIFENIELEMPASIKKVIDTTLQNGVHIWHIRDKDTFKGIKNFNCNNVEMKWLDNGNTK